MDINELIDELINKLIDMAQVRQLRHDLGLDTKGAENNLVAAEDALREQIAELSALMADAELSALLDQAEIARLQQWVHDLQSGMYINCVYCGHRYGGPDSGPAVMADVLKQHIEQCPKHPLSKAKTEITRLTARIAELERTIKSECIALPYSNECKHIWRINVYNNKYKVCDLCGAEMKKSDK